MARSVRGDLSWVVDEVLRFSCLRLRGSLLRRPSGVRRAGLKCELAVKAGKIVRRAGELRQVPDVHDDVELDLQWVYQARSICP